MRPFVDFHFSDFVTCGMDELCNQAAKIRYMFGGQVKLPLVVWCPDGAGLRAAAQHSQSLEAWFVHTPGLKVVVPSEPADVKGLIKAAIRDDDPVMFFQHKRLFAKEGHVPEDAEFLVPLGQAAIKQAGTDVSLFTYGSGYYLCLEAAQTLSKQGISVEIVDLRTLKPLDMNTVAQSVKKTYRAVIVHPYRRLRGRIGRTYPERAIRLSGRAGHQSGGQGRAHPIFARNGGFRTTRRGRRRERSPRRDIQISRS
jgi:pyruvate dehydrogenase E1 component beta subunit